MGEGADYRSPMRLIGSGSILRDVSRARVTRAMCGSPSPITASPWGCSRSIAGNNGSIAPMPSSKRTDQATSMIARAITHVMAAAHICRER